MIEETITHFSDPSDMPEEEETGMDEEVDESDEGESEDEDEA